MRSPLATAKVPNFKGAAIAFYLVLRNIRQASIVLTQRSSVIVGGMVDALVGAKAFIILGYILQRSPSWELLPLYLLYYSIRLYFLSFYWVLFFY